MKKYYLLLPVILLFCFTIEAQNYKDAKKALESFSLITENISKLIEAEKLIQGVPSGKDAEDAAYYLTKGDIYNTIASQIVIIKQTGLGSLDKLPKVTEPAMIAYNAYAKALAIAHKSANKYELSKALKGIQETQLNLYNLGIYSFEDNKYNSSYEHFNSVLKAHALLKFNNKSSSIDDANAYDDQQYITALAALNAGKTSEALNLFEQLYKSNYDKAVIYESLYKLKIEENENAINEAYKYLEEGRKKYPEDVALLFAQINHFLKQGKLNELINKLKMAIAKEPDNVVLYSTLGNVFDNLYQKESQAGNKQKATEYFNNALNYYNQALNKNSKYFDAIYSIGALYYNKAAGLTQELLAFGDDFSKEGVKKYDTKKAEVFAEFDKSLPYFKKAENLDPNDINTLIALKEIYARKDDLTTSNEFKKRLEKVKNGGKNDLPYFKE